MGGELGGEVGMFIILKMILQETIFEDDFVRNNFFLLFLRLD